MYSTPSSPLLFFYYRSRRSRSRCRRPTRHDTMQSKSEVEDMMIDAHCYIDSSTTP